MSRVSTTNSFLKTVTQFIFFNESFFPTGGVRLHIFSLNNSFPFRVSKAQLEENLGVLCSLTKTVKDMLTWDFIQLASTIRSMYTAGEHGRCALSAKPRAETALTEWRKKTQWGSYAPLCPHTKCGRWLWTLETKALCCLTISPSSSVSLLLCPGCHKQTSSHVFFKLHQGITAQGMKQEHVHPQTLTMPAVFHLLSLSLDSMRNILQNEILAQPVRGAKWHQRYITPKTNWQ